MLKRYQKVVRAWSVVFFVVGLLFLFAPARVASELTGLASLVGLAGTIRMAGDTIGFGLTLSLMGTITWLAHWSARHPADPLPYRSLLIAKGISTAAFLMLAATNGPAWLVCAGGDAFVALTLWGARRWGRAR